VDSERKWKLAERYAVVVIAPLCAVLGLLCGALAAYYAAASYHGWDKQAAAPVSQDHAGGSAMTLPPWLGFGLLGIAVALLLTSWGIIVIIRRAEKRKAAGQEFIPKGNLISLNEIEFNPGRLRQAAPWLELNLTFSNATGYQPMPSTVTGRVTVSGQDFHAHIELADTVQSYGSGPFFKVRLKIPVTASEAEYCLDCIRRQNLSVGFPDSTVTCGIIIYYRPGPAPLLYVWLPRTVGFDTKSLRSDPYIPWQPEGR
jgi:hypothetical protein